MIHFHLIQFSFSVFLATYLTTVWSRKSGSASSMMLTTSAMLPESIFTSPGKTGRCTLQVPNLFQGPNLFQQC